MKVHSTFFRRNLALAISAAIGMAYSIAVNAQTQLEEIVVTAEFREASLQDTPIAITAITGELLNAKGMTNLVEITAQAPNVSLKPGGMGRSGMMAYIRGIGQYDFIAAVEPGVGVYVDDVYYTQLTGSLLHLLDVDRVEVLRGPQGTLSGRNSIGGAIKLFTNKPGEDKGGFIEAGLGSYNKVSIRGVGEVELAPDKVFARFGGYGVSRDGYVKGLDYGCTHPGSGVFTNRGADDCLVDKFGNQNFVVGRGQIRWLASDTVDVTIAGDYLNDKSGAPAFTILHADRTPLESIVLPNGTFLNPTVTLPNPDGSQTFYRDHIFVTSGPNRPANDPVNDPYAVYGNFFDSGPQLISAGTPATGPGSVPVNWKPSALPSRNYLTNWGVSAKIDWDINDTMSLTSITAYREYDVWMTWDADGSPVGVTQLDNRLDNWQLTQEIRLNGSASDAFDYTLGGFYLDQNSHYEARVDLNYALIDFIHGPDPTPATTFALFAHGVWHATDRMNVTAGIRYSDEKKDYTHFRHNPDNSDIGSKGPTFPGAPDLINIRLTGINGLPAHFEDTVVDWRVAVDYAMNDDINTYASVSTGYKSGGVNPRPFFPIQLQTFDPETLTSYEIGFKSMLADRTLRFNAAAFYTDYSDIQLVLNRCEVPAFINPTGFGPPCLKPANVGTAEVKGLEFEAEWYPMDNLSFDASLSFLDFEYTEVSEGVFVCGGLPQNEQRSPYTPEKQGHIGGQWRFVRGSLGNLTLRLDVNHQGEVYAEPCNAPTNKVDSYTVGNARLWWDSPDGDWQATFEVMNLTDELYYHTKFDQTLSVGQVMAQPALPRTYGFSIRYNFE